MTTGSISVEKQKNTANNYYVRKVQTEPYHILKVVLGYTLIKALYQLALCTHYSNTEL